MRASLLQAWQPGSLHNAHAFACACAQPANSYRVAPLHKLRFDTIPLDKNRHTLFPIPLDSTHQTWFITFHWEWGFSFPFCTTLASYTVNKAHVVWNWTRSCRWCDCCCCCCDYFYCSLPILFRTLRTIYLCVWCWKWHQICPLPHMYACNRKEVEAFSLSLPLQFRIWLCTSNEWMSSFVATLKTTFWFNIRLEYCNSIGYFTCALITISFNRKYIEMENEWGQCDVRWGERWARHWNNHMHTTQWRHTFTFTFTFILILILILAYKQQSMDIIIVVAAHYFSPDKRLSYPLVSNSYYVRLHISIVATHIDLDISAGLQQSVVRVHSAIVSWNMISLWKSVCKFWNRYQIRAKSFLIIIFGSNRSKYTNPPHLVTYARIITRNVF